MEKSSIETIELGNLLFGHSRGKFLVPRNEDYQGAFLNFLERSGFDAGGNIDNPHLEDFCNDETNCFENDIFILRPYYWGDDEEMCELPNFVYKPTGFEMRWYKYPLRDTYANQDLTPIDFWFMLAECEKSLDQIYGGEERIVYRPKTNDEIMKDFRDFLPKDFPEQEVPF